MIAVFDLRFQPLQGANFAIVDKHVNKAFDLAFAVKYFVRNAGVLLVNRPQQRADIAKLNDALRGGLEKKGLKVNQADPAPFREMLRKAGFYADWKAKFGNEAWETLEGAVGKLA